ncbi:eCIS core domain-containing protein [Streptantibioticus silvisoli]|uniref:eCIS core domain-containing protein n=1 Tax=Streptantibioticus silvisoli TaxID=2705255 RepID=UPI003558DFBF
MRLRHPTGAACTAGGARAARGARVRRGASARLGASAPRDTRTVSAGALQRPAATRAARAALRRLGADFADVRVHNGPAARASAIAIRTRAAPRAMAHQRNSVRPSAPRTYRDPGAFSRIPVV